MIIGIPRETFPSERRVALIPDFLPALIKLGVQVSVEAGAGLEASFTDAAYIAKGAGVTSRTELFASADVLLFVSGYGSNLVEGKRDLSRFRRGQLTIGMFDPLLNPSAMQELAEKGLTVMALELIPRISRAQSMDVLSSMANIAGYKAVLLAAAALPRVFPMFMTAAGTILPSKVFVIGAGVAGLQAIATARRLGAIVKGYDVRPAVKEQVESLGAKFVEMELETSSAEAKTGYAQEMGEEFYRRQRELMARVVAESDAVITTAAIPGKKAPVLITADMVDKMAPGSVIVDLAAGSGGNCELTKADQTYIHSHVTIIGPTNLPSTVPYHASQMYSKNITDFLKLILDKSGALSINREDEIIRETLVVLDGAVVHPRLRDMLGIAVPKSTSTSGVTA